MDLLSLRGHASLEGRRYISFSERTLRHPRGDDRARDATENRTGSHASELADVRVLKIRSIILRRAPPKRFPLISRQI